MNFVRTVTIAVALTKLALQFHPIRTVQIVLEVGIQDALILLATLAGYVVVMGALRASVY